MQIFDDLGQRVVLESPAERVIALYGAYNEIVAAMGLEERLVGRTKADRLPASILSKPSIGTHMRPNVELVIGLQPDLIIQEAGRREAMVSVAQLKNLGFPVAVFQIRTFDRLFSVIDRLGRLLGVPKRAAELRKAMRNRLRAVNQRIEKTTYHPRVFFEVRYPNLLGAGRESIVNDIIEHAGGRNCLTVDKKFARVDFEALIACNPEAYVVHNGAMNPNPGNPGDRPHFRTLRAVEEGNILEVDEQVYSRPGPRSVSAVEELAIFLHPHVVRREKP